MFNTTSANATAVSQFFFEAPFADLQQNIVNQVGYLGDVLSDPASIGDVFSTIGANLQDVFTATTLLGEPSDAVLLAVVPHPLDSLHGFMWQVVLGKLGLPAADEPIPALTNFVSSPLSGVLIGGLGPIVSPMVQIGNSIGDIVGHLNDGADPMAALQDLIAMPAKVVDAIFNGATLNLDALVPLVVESGLLPEDIDLNSLSFTVGGLLSPGSTMTGIGGSIFNAVGLDVDGAFGEMSIPGQGIGPISALTNFSQIIASTLGWDGTGNPLTELAFPLFDVSEPAGAAASLAGDLPELLAGGF